MALTLELKPEVEAALARQAAAQGSALEPYAASLLEQAAGVAPETKSEESGARPPGRKSLARLFEESPFRGLDIDFERDPDTGREIEL